jgi:predicted double-glycine peptidase
MEISQDKLFQDFPSSSSEGYSVEELMNIAKEKGLEAFVLQMPARSIRIQIQKGRPVICGLKKTVMDDFFYHFPFEGGFIGEIIRGLAPEYNHYVIVIGFKDDRLLIMDPAIGLVSLSEKRFQRMHGKCNDLVLLAAKKQTDKQSHPKGYLREITSDKLRKSQG